MSREVIWFRPFCDNNHKQNFKNPWSRKSIWFDQKSIRIMVKVRTHNSTHVSKFRSDETWSKYLESFKFQQRFHREVVSEKLSCQHTTSLEFLQEDQNLISWVVLMGSPRLP